MQLCRDELMHIFTSHLFLSNGLLLNPDKTYVILLATTQRANSIPLFSNINHADSSVPLSNNRDNVKLIGITLDITISFDTDMSAISKPWFYHIHALRHIRPALTDDVARTIVYSLVGCQLNYASSVYLVCL